MESDNGITEAEIISLIRQAINRVDVVPIEPTRMVVNGNLINLEFATGQAFTVHVRERS